MHENNKHKQIVDDFAYGIYFIGGDDEAEVRGDDNTVSYKYTLPLLSKRTSLIARADPSADMSTENPNRSPSASPIIVSPTGS